ncbi:MAG: hypothetical protein HYZ65_00645 [Burkholderiales bacterium]|nr:hypothetical protein [Burkholderiales bacterium]
MPYEMMREYEVEYASARLPDSEHWAAMLTIYGPSRNPMHRNCVFPMQRVALDAVLTSAAQAEAEARKVAQQMIAQGRQHDLGG